MTKILTNDQVDGWVAELRSANRKFGYTCGAFELLHAGHVDYLARSRAQCDALLVAGIATFVEARISNAHV